MDLKSGNEQFKTPVGNVTFVLHKGGEFDPNTQKFTQDTKILNEKTLKNLVVLKASQLMAGRMCPTGHAVGGSNVAILAGGFQYLAVGTGVGTGTTQAPQSENSSVAQLRAELTRKAFTTVNYLTGTTPTPTITNKLQLTTTFTEGEAIGPIVEMGLFGGNASAVANSGYLFNHKVFAVINKDNTVRLTIIWEITF